MSDMTIANTILAQLGGRKFLVMTGAKNLTGHENALSFKLPKFAGVKVNYVKITLNVMDLYDVQYSAISTRNGAFKVTEIAASAGLYAEDLQADFTRETGLNTHL